MKWVFKRVTGYLLLLATAAASPAVEAESPPAPPVPAPAQAAGTETATANGAAVYAKRCSICHGDHREGIPPAFPPLTGIQHQGGLTNYRAPSVDPKAGLFIVDAHPSYSLYFAKPADGDYGWAGADYGLWGEGVIEAIDYQTGKIRWSHHVGPGGSGAGVMTTDSGLTITGDAEGNLLALNTQNGKTLWHAGTGSPIQSSPICYELDGREYIMTSSGGVLFAWALPEKLVGAGNQRVGAE